MNVLSETIHSRLAWVIAVAATAVAAGFVLSSVGATAAPTGCDLVMSVAATEGLTAVGGLPRTHVDSECGPTIDERSYTSLADSTDGPGTIETTNARYDIYGDCSADADNACPFPLQIVTSPACQGSIDDLMLAARSPYGPAIQVSTRRGVRVASMDGGTVLHVATGRLTVSIIADTSARADAAFAQLRGPAPNPSGDLSPEVAGLEPDSDPACQG